LVHIEVTAAAQIRTCCISGEMCKEDSLIKVRVEVQFAVKAHRAPIFLYFTMPYTASSFSVFMDYVLWTQPYKTS